MVEEAEYVLRDNGFYDVRVRLHELSKSTGTPFNGQSTWLARIEVGQTELKRLLENGLSERVAVELKKIGFAHVTLDLQGYRRGSLNEPLGVKELASR